MRADGLGMGKRLSKVGEDGRARSVSSLRLLAPPKAEQADRPRSVCRPPICPSQSFAPARWPPCSRPLLSGSGRGCHLLPSAQRTELGEGSRLDWGRGRRPGGCSHLAPLILGRTEGRCRPSRPLGTTQDSTAEGYHQRGL